MQASVTQILESLTDAQSESYKHSVQYLINSGEQSLPSLLGALLMDKYTSIRPIIIQIIQRIGESTSIDCAIPVFLGFLKDANKPIFKTAFNALLTMGDKVVYYALDILTYYWSDDMWVLNTCALLERMDSGQLDILIPELLHLARIGTKENCLDESAIGVLKKIGSPKANVAVPLLGEKLLLSDRNDLRLASIEALQNMDPSIVKPLIPILKECLLDKSDTIRSSTQNLLIKLESPD